MRKFLCGILAFIICIFSICIYVQAEEVNDLQTMQEELQDQINDVNNELENVQSRLSENLQQVQKLDENIETSNQELEELNIKIVELQDSIDEVEEKLKIAEEKYERQRKILESRLVAMYESGDTKYLDVILSSKNISDFLSNYFLITEVASHDTDLLEEMELQKNEIELDKRKLDFSRNQLATIKQNQTRTAKILENTKSVRENFISRLSDQEKELQNSIDEMNVRYAEVNAEILALALGGLDSQYIGGELAWPVPGYTRVTSRYGMRVHPITGIYKLHTGTDISAPTGANFVAANDGIVTKAGYNSAYGNMVIIDHGGGISTLYAHGVEITVQVGDFVKRGETVVLKVGSTGYSTGPHAHFEVRINGIPTDPMPYITNGVVPEPKNNEIENVTSN